MNQRPVGQKVELTIFFIGKNQKINEGLEVRGRERCYVEGGGGRVISRVTTRTSELDM